MAVYHVFPPDTPPNVQEIGYALAKLEGGAWTWFQEGIINEGAFPNVSLTDPSVAYDSFTGEFLVCAMTRDQARIILARWEPIGGQFGPWVVVSQASGAESFDKPWIVAGEMTLGPADGPLYPDPIGMREFYITWDGGPALKYLRSRDGGETWRGGDALTNLNNPSSVITPCNVPAPRVFGSQPLYVVFRKDDLTLEFVRGDDVNGGPHDGEVRFTRLVDEQTGQNLTVHLNIGSASLFFYVPPQNPFTGANGPGFDLAVDPTNANRLYLVFNDTATSDPNDKDVNIYLRVLTRNPTTGRWSVGLAILVADDGLPPETDQFLPAIVELRRRIGVLLHEVAVVVVDDVGFAVEAHIRFWTSFMGHAPAPRDPYANKSVIWSTQILLP